MEEPGRPGGIHPLSERYLMRNAKTGRGTSSRGQALIEFALVLPVLFLLVINVVNFGGMLSAWVVVANAARAGAQHMVMSDAWLFGPSPPSAAEVTRLVTSDLASLPNRASAQVSVCINVGGTVSPAGCGAPGDPEAATFNSATVNVTYIYRPLIPLWSFPRLAIHLTTPPTSIHRRVVMRCAGGCVAS